MKASSAPEAELLIVGIASSAGGLTPLKALVSHVFCNSNMSLMVVPHLPRNIESHLPSILQPMSTLDLQVMTNGMQLKPRCLYILPPGAYARVEEGKIYLDPRPEWGANLAANVLFKSLAENYGKNAIGVVLSGAAVGSDGADGVIAIKLGGGHSYAQDPVTAEFSSMPEAAISTGCIDSVLSAEEIGNALTLISLGLS